MKTFDQLNESEILALAISSEEEDGRIYADFAARACAPGISRQRRGCSTDMAEPRRT